MTFMFMDQVDLLARYNLRPSGVLHVGASEGQEVEMYLAAGIPKLILIEALPDVYSNLVDRIKEVPEAHAVNACISDSSVNGVKFNVASNAGQSSSLLNLGIHRDLHPDVEFIDQITVDTTRIDELRVDLSGVNYLVTDLQGCDLRAIRSAGHLLDQFTCIYSEVNNAQVYEGNDTIEEMDEYLGERGFRRVETTWVLPEWGDAFYVRERR
jgi:FkbM family methyltransferase